MTPSSLDYMKIFFMLVLQRCLIYVMVAGISLYGVRFCLLFREFHLLKF
jgi:hypothetical protein